MGADAQTAAGFYGTARGAVAARLLRERLDLLWPDLRGQAILGMGYSPPFLRHWREQAGRCIAVNPAQAAPNGRLRRWPAQGNLSCAAEEDALPFPDLSFDRVLLVHGLEAAENARRMLRELWRVLRDDGRLLVVAPNRRGLWAHVDSTPFGQGQPYSAGQIGRLLAESMFRVERRDTALYLPPTEARAVLRSAALIERVGRGVAPQLAGVTLTEAIKDVYAVMPLKAVARRRVVLVDAG